MTQGSYFVKAINRVVCLDYLFVYKDFLALFTADLPTRYAVLMCSKCGKIVAGSSCGSGHAVDIFRGADHARDEWNHCVAGVRLRSELIWNLFGSQEVMAKCKAI
jgi:hypothetical protein